MPKIWRRLTETLESSDEDVVELSTTDVSTTVGDVDETDLQSGRWWKKAGSEQAKAVEAAGYEVDSVDDTTGTIRFKRKTT